VKLRIGNKYFGRTLDFRVRLFNILAMGSIVVTLFATITILPNREPFSVFANFIGAPFSFLLMRYATRTQNYKRCYLLTVIVL